uniref:AlNc14C41G3523 protein n=1 Tax=Albugo laibachii Nc14 TaxID=890382 RepID=F0W9R9_9STRA|nr:AlNc14C41G3523 [Albugo laibachii Nc14]|eukprot:CCA17887.1 AlNc14C41G3523 [Albugo laibachii Nc14]
MQRTPNTRTRNGNSANTAPTITTMKRVGGGYVPRQAPAVTPPPVRLTPTMEIRRLKQRNLQLTRELADANVKLAETTIQLSAANQKISHMDGVITNLESKLRIGQLRFEESKNKLDCAVKKNSQDAVKLESLMTDHERSKAAADSNEKTHSEARVQILST